MDAILTGFFRREVQTAALAELVGTFFLTLAALLGPGPFVVALTLGVFVYSIGGLSGSHLNPAVTVGLASIGRIKWDRAVVYVVAQIVGALLARLIAGLVGDLAPDYQAAGVFAEFFGFGFLILTVLSVTHAYIPDAGTGVAIGGALAAGLYTSDGILNPAVAIAMGEALSAATWATILSGLAFALLFRVLRRDRPIP